MKTPLERIRLGAIVLSAVFLVAVVGYRVIGGYPWIESLWLVVITLSSVGFGERSQMGSAMQLWTIVVIIVGISASAYTLGGFIQFILEGELDLWLGQRRMTREIEQLSDHVIICGFGRIGLVLGEDLKRQKQPLVVVDQDLARIEEAKSRHHPCLVGDATEEPVLLRAGLRRCKTLFTGLPSDAANVFITLTARNLNPTVQIIARAEHPSTEKKLRQAGANRIVMPSLIGAHHVERMITRPSTADLMELVAESSFTDLELDEVKVVPSGKLVGVSVHETEAHRRRLLVVAVKQRDGSMLFNPDGSYTFQADDVLMVMGHEKDIQRFRTEYGL
jgi:voltage-gated potassium channel